MTAVAHRRETLEDSNAAEVALKPPLPAVAEAGTWIL